MTTRLLLSVSVLGVMSAVSDAGAASQVVNLASAGVDSRTVTDRGSIHIFSVIIPEDIAGKRLDSVLLEFEVNTELDASEYPDMSPIIAVYPLLAAASRTESPEVVSSFPTLTNLKVGDGQRVLVDVTDIVRGWIAEPTSNHGLVLGSFAGPKLSKLEIGNSFVSTGEFARVTFFYQNRFGNRLSARRE